jgi:hypothetical protein
MLNHGQPGIQPTIASGLACLPASAHIPGSFGSLIPYMPENRMVSTKSLFSRLALLTMALAVALVAVWSQVLDPSCEVTFTAAAENRRLPSVGTRE